MYLSLFFWLLLFLSSSLCETEQLNTRPHCMTLFLMVMMFGRWYDPPPSLLGMFCDRCRIWLVISFTSWTNRFIIPLRILEERLFWCHTLIKGWYPAVGVYSSSTAFLVLSQGVSSLWRQAEFAALKEITVITSDQCLMPLHPNPPSALYMTVLRRKKIPDLSLTVSLI